MAGAKRGEVKALVRRGRGYLIDQGLHEYVHPLLGDETLGVVEKALVEAVEHGLTHHRVLQLCVGPGMERALHIYTNTHWI